MITRKQKEEMVSRISEDIKNSKLIILTDYRGLNVSAISSLRNNLRESGCKYKVVKNKLTKLAAKDAGVEGLDPFLEGPTAMAFNDSDPIEATKIMLKMAKKLEHLSIKSGVLEGRVLDIKEIEVLGDIPSQDILLSMVCGAFQAPITGLATALKGNINNLVYVLDAIRSSKEAS